MEGGWGGNRGWRGEGRWQRSEAGGGGAGRVFLRRTSSCAAGAWMWVPRDGVRAPQRELGGGGGLLSFVAGCSLRHSGEYGAPRLAGSPGDGQEAEGARPCWGSSGAAPLCAAPLHTRDGSLLFPLGFRSAPGTAGVRRGRSERGLYRALTWVVERPGARFPSWMRPPVRFPGLRRQNARP